MKGENIMEELKIMPPTIKDQSKINNLAKQVHKLHVNWDTVQICI